VSKLPPPVTAGTGAVGASCDQPGALESRIKPNPKELKILLTER